jgi:hypothetical protein
MQPRAKPRPPGEKVTARPVPHLGLHDVTNPSASARAASLRRMIANAPALRAATGLPVNKPPAHP